MRYRLPRFRGKGQNQCVATFWPMDFFMKCANVPFSVVPRIGDRDAENWNRVWYGLLFWHTFGTVCCFLLLRFTFNTLHDLLKVIILWTSCTQTVNGPVHIKTYKMNDKQTQRRLRPAFELSLFMYLQDTLDSQISLSCQSMQYRKSNFFL